MTASLAHAWWAVLRRDLMLSVRRLGELGNPVVFFAAVVSLFPLALGADVALLRAVGPGVVWVGALLASLLSLEGLFRADFEDGSLEQLLLSPHPTSVLVSAKILAHWLVTGVPLLLITPLLGVLLQLSTPAQVVLFGGLLLGTPILSLLGSVAVALTLGLPRGGLLVSVLLLPLFAPVLVFGAGAVSSALLEMPVLPYFYMLGAELVLAITVVPVATAAALRASLGS
ncbi:heme exporter protein CcmB [Candidatus Macondimonas diazotrophica]|jgi:heme exporter protein B|uniref:Heme exporter protein B n=1 Tax=Candidatus Macondimonas diazotrophica TaxID=2305248 RepID=A0A4Z0F9X4_9GAMM|nr:heme exporter protein CcmB [Candidatus Macondimonas diazotrophica]NCU00939.1 heme exporter protein CcmB [Candidatus Macondimonas diazotrophica]TFZ83236.1 heme exporter protein CcmB [Candidatus Macondimonas diazotrophica]HBG29579.1 heme exporter protein CcmB [Gammaproteobacteria bacterium]HBG50246.1 heme exporter protein CcmB [Gammaproteobacteria bacterium]